MNRAKIEAEEQSTTEAQFATLADEFMDRLNNGELPEIESYAHRHPEFAERIRETFPLLCILRPAPDAPAARTDIPERIEGFRILGRLGRGGMGVVYEAVQEALGRHVALKVISASARNDPVLAERFRREARAAARLHHTHIVPIFQVSDSGQLYYAMQLIRGMSLSEVVRRRKEIGEAPTCVGSTVPNIKTDATAPPTPLAPPTNIIPNETGDYFRSVARWISQAADALEHAHAHGILHRDIKPGNLMLDEHGMIWVTDFGLAKVHGTDDLTETGTVVGTIRYMAPECLSGDAETRSDIYSLGVTLYELLTLQPAFDDTDAQRLMRKVAECKPASPRSLDKRIPRDLETIILKCIQRSPQHRYATARELADDLQRFLDGRTIAARRASPVEQAWRWSRRNPVVAGLLALMLVLLTTIAVGGAVTSWKLEETGREIQAKLERAERAEREEHAARTREADARRAAQETAWRSLLDQGALAIREPSPERSNRVRQILDNASRIHPAISPSVEDLARFRGLIVENSLLPELVEERRFALVQPGSTIRSTMAPDGTAAIIQQNKEVHVWRNSDMAPFWSIPRQEGWNPESIQFSPDGKYLIVSMSGPNGERCEIWKLGEAAARCLIPKANRALFSSDSSRALCLSSIHGQIPVLVNLAADPVQFTQLPWLDRSRSHQLSPDGAFLADIPIDVRSLRVRKIADGKTIVNVPLPADGSGIVWFPDRKRLVVLLAIGAAAHPISIISLVERKEIGRIEHPGIVQGLTVSSTGDWIATVASDQLVRLWDSHSGKVIAAAENRNQIRVMFGQSDRELFTVTGRGEWTRFRVQSGNCYRRFDRPPGEYTSRSDDLDARWRLVRVTRVNRPDDDIVLWDMESNHAIGTLPDSNRAYGFITDRKRRRVIAFDRQGGWSCLLWTIPEDGMQLAIAPPKRYPFESGKPWSASVLLSGNGKTLIGSIAEKIRNGVPRSPSNDSLQLISLTNLFEGKDTRVRGPSVTYLPDSNDDNDPYSLQSISHDGRWLATSMSRRRLDGVPMHPNTVWDLAGDAPRAVDIAFTDNGLRLLRFSSDSCWLLEGTSKEYLLRRVGNWEIVHRIPVQDATRQNLPPGVFCGNGKLVALCTKKARIVLFDLETGNEWAELPIHDRDLVAALGLTHDGGKMIATSHSGVVHVWDLNALQKEWAKRGVGEIPRD